MKKTYLIISFLILICTYSCTGYKPIFGSSNLEFKIANYTVKGDKKLGNQIYSKLYNLSKYNESNPASKSIYILIDISKEKKSTAKNSAGKILEYKIGINGNIEIKDYLTDNIILNYNTASSFSYKVQDQHSETVKLENKTLENLLNKIYQDLIIQMSSNMSDL